MPKILAACKKMSTPNIPYKPKLTIIICGKRHHTRFYPTSEDSADHLGNPKPGTVVDRGITVRASSYRLFQWSFTLFMNRLSLSLTFTFKPIQAFREQHGQHTIPSFTTKINLMQMRRNVSSTMPATPMYVQREQ